VSAGLAVIFFLSGAAALLYQVVWQRALYVIYGVNVESVAVVVTAFLVGLGLGSLFGGALSRDPRRARLRWFALLELGLGLFGVFSLPLFHTVGALTLQLSPLATGLSTFALVLLPTVAMGATLPLLVAHAVERSRNVGESVSWLYAVNTFGSAVASVLGAVVLLGSLGQRRTTWVAAAINLAVSAGAALLARRG
jgi:predicted membrane-bound spermidine synthase